MQQRHLAAEPVEDTCEFHRDVTGANHQNAVGQALEMEDLVRRDGKIAAGNFRLQNWMRADGHQDDASAHQPAGFHQTDCMRVLDDRTFADDFDPG